jgi:hypothetical protein
MQRGHPFGIHTCLGRSWRLYVAEIADGDDRGSEIVVHSHVRCKTDGSAFWSYDGPYPANAWRLENENYLIALPYAPGFIEAASNRDVSSVRSVRCRIPVDFVQHENKRYLTPYFAAPYFAAALAENEASGKRPKCLAF